jgi:hypothetical protein
MSGARSLAREHVLTSLCAGQRARHRFSHQGRSHTPPSQPGPPGGGPSIRERSFAVSRGPGGAALFAVARLVALRRRVPPAARKLGRAARPEHGPDRGQEQRRGTGLGRDVGCGNRVRRASCERSSLRWKTRTENGLHDVPAKPSRSVLGGPLEFPDRRMADHITDEQKVIADIV